jgi:O-acetyl-ADP-ribose deacetylase (regulator of RNase III)
MEVLSMNDDTAYVVNQAKVSIIQGDITRQTTDAIVNAANSSLMGGGGVDGAIHRAGGPAILEECIKIVERQGRLPAGQAVITTAGNMKAKHVIHTVGPIWHGGSQNESALLASAYRESLKVAAANNLASVSFPSISTGAYGYPVNKAAVIALREVVAFLKQSTSVKEVVFVLFDARTLEAYADALWDIKGEKG